MGLVWVNVLQVVLCVGLAILVFAFLEKPLRQLMDQLVRLEPATTFYVRVMALVLVLLAMKRAVSFIDKPNDAWGSAWTLMSNWADVMEPFTTVVLVFAGLITVLAAVLRRSHEQ